MQVNAKHTEVRTIKVELDDSTQVQVAQNLPTLKLVKIIKERLFKDAIDKITKGMKKATYTVASRYHEGKQRLVLIEVDASWDYHNDVGVDEVIRPLTDDEVNRFLLIDKTVTSLIRLTM